MATMDGNDNYDTPYQTGQAPMGPGNPIYDRVAQLYQLALGREGTPAEITQWSQGRTVNDLGRIQQEIYATPEAQAWGSRNANQPQTPTQTGTTTTPGPAPAPTPGPAPAPVTAGAPPPSVGTSAASSAPSYTPPAPYTPPPAFTYADFKGPTAEDVINDPGYQFERDQGLSAIGANRAAAGTLNTGGTLKDYVGFANNLASTHFGNVYARDLSTYGTNRANALDTYNTNYGTQYKDPWTINYQSQYTDPFAMNMQSAGMNQQNLQFNASLGQNNNQFNSSLDFNKWLENYKRTVTDPFDQRYKTLSLL